MKTLFKVFLSFVLLAFGWQLARNFFSLQEQEIRSDIRAGFEKHFHDMAAASKQRFGLVQLYQSTTDSPHVVLIHGLDDPGKVWMNLAPELAENKYNLWQMTYPNDQPVTTSARQFHEALATLHNRQIKTIRVIAHSMGGLVTREVLTNPLLQCTENQCDHGQRPVVTQLIMVGTPNHGSELARFRFLAEIREQVERFLSGETAWLDWIFDGAGEAGLDLIPESEFLVALNNRPKPHDTQYQVIAGVIGEQERLALKEQLSAYSNDRNIAELIDSLFETIGDGLVTLESAKLNGVPVEIVAGNHLSIIRNLSKSSTRVPPAIPVIRQLLQDFQPAQ